MRRLVRFLPGLLVLGVATTALVLVLWTHDAGADSPPQSVDQGIPVPTVELGVPITSPGRQLPLSVEPGSSLSPESLVKPAPATTLSSPPPPSTAALTPPSDAVDRVAAAGGVLTPSSHLPPDVAGAPATPAPVLRDAPSPDPKTLTAPLGDVFPSLEIQAELPAVPSLPSLPSPATPEPATDPPPPDPAGVAAALPDAPMSISSPHLAAAAVLPILDAQSTPVAAAAGGVLPLFDDRTAPARAPPGQLPLHPCPHVATPHSSPGDSAIELTPCGNHAPLRAHLSPDARAYASSSVLDPLLRPD